MANPILAMGDFAQVYGDEGGFDDHLLDEPDFEMFSPNPDPQSGVFGHEAAAPVAQVVPAAGPGGEEAPPHPVIPVVGLAAPQVPVAAGHLLAQQDKQDAAPAIPLVEIDIPPADRLEIASDLRYGISH